MYPTEPSRVPADGARSGPADSIRFAVLGPVRAWRADEEIDCGPPVQRKVLALLLVAAGRPVNMSEFVNLLWESTPPVSAVNSVHRSIGLLRRQLEPDLPMRQRGRWLVRQQGNYLLDVNAESLDLLRFRELSATGSRLMVAGQPAEALPLFLTALALWQGPCGGGLDVTTQAQPEFTRIDRERILVAQEAAEAGLRAGRPGVVLPVLRELAALNPTDEALHAALILSLAAAGYQAEALGAFTRVSRVLVEQLGVVPGATLRAAQEAVLRQQAAGPPESAAGPAATGIASEPATAELAEPVSGMSGTYGPGAQGVGVLDRLVRPAQLPGDLRVFAGREEEMARLTQSLAPDPSAVVIAAIGGIAGVGKTALAVHCAYVLAPQYPDGQLYVNLRGFDPTGSAMGPHKALSGFLHILGVPPQRIPADLAEAAALYRSVLNGRRILVVLDNARDVDQIQPLLPSSPGALVIVTSRRQLLGLAASHGAQLLDLQPFSTDDALDTLAKRFGRQRLSAEPAAVDEIVDCCAGLPLAIAIVAARAVMNEQLSMADIAAQLRDVRTRLDVLDANDAAADVRTVFSWSYQLLTPDAATLFRLLSLHGGMDISANAVVSLAGRSGAELRPALTEILRYGLLAERRPGRFSSHDLIQVYATELFAEVDTDADRKAALGRLFDHYLHSVAGVESLIPHWMPTVSAPPAPGVSPEVFADELAAWAWFDRERQVLIATVAQAAGTGFLAPAWQLALSLQTFLLRGGYWHDWVAIMHVALDAARDLDDLAAQAYCHRSLAGAYYFLQRYELATEQLEGARELFDKLGEDAQYAPLEAYFGWITLGQGRLDEAMSHFRTALTVFEEAGDDEGRVYAVSGIGQVFGDRGDQQRAAEVLKQAMELYRKLGDRNGEGYCWAGLGGGHRLLGELPAALDCYRRALELHTSLNDTRREAVCLVPIGDIMLALGDRTGARDSWQRALAIYDELRLPLADPVRARLAELDD